MVRKRIFIAIAVIAVALCGLLTWRYVAARRTKYVIDSLSADMNLAVYYSEGTVSYDEHSTLFYCFHRVTGISFGAAILSRENIELIASGTELQTLDVRGADIKESAIPGLGALDHLQVLKLSRVPVVMDPPGRTEVSPDTRPAEPLLPSPVGPDVPSRALEDADMQFLRNLTQLRELDLGTTNLSDNGVTAFAHLADLETLDLSLTPVGDAGVAAICANHPRLKVLLLANVGGWHEGEYPRLTDASIGAITHLAELEVLDVSGSQISAEALGLLAQMGSLRELSVDECMDLTYGHLRELKARRPKLLVHPWVPDEAGDDELIDNKGVGGPWGPSDAD